MAAVKTIHRRHVRCHQAAPLAAACRHGAGRRTYWQQMDERKGECEEAFGVLVVVQPVHYLEQEPGLFISLFKQKL